MEKLYQRGLKQPVIVEEGEIKGYSYCIRSLGSHPCAYVKIPDGHPYFQVDYVKCYIRCHCGLTYAGDKLGAFTDTVRTGWWIGWDYAHAGDYCCYPGITIPGKTWTLTEIRAEVASVIDQLIKVTADEKA